MDANYKKMTDFLVGLGVTDIPHTHKTYLAHLVAVYRYLESKGASPDVCRAGMFHSIYGTEMFQGFKLPLEKRGEVRQLIGERAERMAYLNCAMDRASLDRAVEKDTEPYRIVDRITGEEVLVSREDFDGLCQVHLFDFLEQVPRSKRWDYRRAGYRAIASRLGGIAQQEYDRVFAEERSKSANQS